MSCGTDIAVTLSLFSIARCGLQRSSQTILFTSSPM